MFDFDDLPEDRGAPVTEKKPDELPKSAAETEILMPPLEEASPAAQAPAAPPAVTASATEQSSPAADAPAAPTVNSSVTEVAKFIEGMGYKDLSEKLEEDEVDGEALYLLEVADLTGYGMKKGPALKLHNTLKSMKAGNVQAATPQVNAAEEEKRKKQEEERLKAEEEEKRKKQEEEERLKAEEEEKRKKQEAEERLKAEEEEKRRKQEEEERLKAEEEEKTKKQEEEERLKAEEAEKRKKQEEEERLKAEEEEKRRKQEEERLKAEEEEKRKKQEEEELLFKLKAEEEEKRKKQEEEERLKAEEEERRQEQEEKDRLREIEENFKRMAEKEEERKKLQAEEEERLLREEEERLKAEEEAKKPKLKPRAEACKTRWNNEEEDSSDEAMGVLSSLGRKFSLWSSAASVAFTMAMSSDPVKAGQQIANMCRSQGGIYVKAAQSASSMEAMFAKEVLEELQSLQDSADPQDWDVVGPRIEKHTPGGIDAIYKEINQEAMNAASVAQVHLATRVTGEKVVIKVLRCDIQKTFDQDIQNYLSMMGMYESATGTPVKWMMEWSMNELKKEIDFRNEADLQEDCAKFMQSNRELKKMSITVPELHSELCTKRVLVMEYIDGCKIIKAPEHFADIYDRERDLKAWHLALETFHATQIFIEGKFHGDPHPGNVMVRKKTGSVKPGETPFEVVVIDHGGYYTLPEDVRTKFAEVWAMMEPPKNETQRLKRKARVKEILNGWGVDHVCRFIIEQMMSGDYGSADPTSTISENGEARRHRWNWQNQKREDLGPPVFADTTKMSPELMKAFGAGNFTRSTWKQLSKGMKGWNFTKIRVDLMIEWAKRAPGLKMAPGC